MKNITKVFVVQLFMLLSGCNEIEVNGKGIEEFISFQARRELEGMGKDQLKEEFRSNPSMSYYQYEDAYKNLAKSSGQTHQYMVEWDPIYLNSKGHLSVKLDGKNNTECYSGVIHQNKTSPIKIRGRIRENGSAGINFAINRFDLDVKSNFNNMKDDIAVMAQYRICF